MAVSNVLIQLGRTEGTSIRGTLSISWSTVPPYVYDAFRPDENGGSGGSFALSFLERLQPRGFWVCLLHDPSRMRSVGSDMRPLFMGSSSRGSHGCRLFVRLMSPMLMHKALPHTRERQLFVRRVVWRIVRRTKTS